MDLGLNFKNGGRTMFLLFLQKIGFPEFSSDFIFFWICKFLEKGEKFLLQRSGNFRKVGVFQVISLIFLKKNISEKARNLNSEEIPRNPLFCHRGGVGEKTISELRCLNQRKDEDYH